MRILIIVFFLSNIFFCQAQETTKSRKAIKVYREAKSALTSQNFNESKDLLEKALIFDDQFVEAWILLGDVFVEMGDKLRAIESYKKSILIDPEFSFPMYYRLAITDHSLRNYSESLEHIQKYLTNKHITSNFRKKAFSLKKSCEFSINAMKSPVTFNPVNMGINVNSNADEYLPALSADGSILIFTRSENVKGVRNEDFYISCNDTDQWQFAKNLGEPINTQKN